MAIATMTRMISLLKLRVPLGGQEIELQHVEFGADAPAGADAAAHSAAARSSVPMNLLRTRVREKSRFTVFDIDPLTAEQWGQALLDWARAQPRA
ncbi:MAG: hypothetical protein WA210_03255 [Burkholderiaceae bacterium]